MRESEYTRTITKLLPREVYALKLSTSYTAGVPDSWYSGSRGDLWVEWKYLKSVPGTVDLCGGRHPVITQLQQDWLKCRHDEGRRVAVIVGTPTGAVIYPGVTWSWKPLTREAFCALMRQRGEIAAWITQQCLGAYASSEIFPGTEGKSLARVVRHS